MCIPTDAGLSSGRTIAFYVVLIGVLGAFQTTPLWAQLPSCNGDPPPPPFELDFNTYPDGTSVAGGDVLLDQWNTVYGIRISTNSALLPMAFDTSNPTGDDPDLGAPNQTCPEGGGPGVGDGGVYVPPPDPPNPFANCENLGMTLIISEDGDPTDPDDNSGGGTLIFRFNELVTIKAMDVLDIEGTVAEPDVTATFYDSQDGGSEVIGSPITLGPTGDNGYEKRTVDISGVSRLEIAMEGSGSYPSITICADGTLPVELTDLSARVDDRDIHVRWSTATETNNAGFYIQHAFDDEAFEDAGFISGNGISTVERTYDFRIHDGRIGSHRVRLAQVDFDGRRIYSHAVEVFVPIAASHVLDPVFPNPVTDNATVAFTVREGGPVSLDLYSVLGRRQKTLYRGSVSPEVTHRIRLDGSELDSGIYFLRLVTGKGSVTRTLVVGTD